MIKKEEINMNFVRKSVPRKKNVWSERRFIKRIVKECRELRSMYKEAVKRKTMDETI